MGKISFKEIKQQRGEFTQLKSQFVSHKAVVNQRLGEYEKSAEHIKLQLHGAIHRLRFYSNLLIHILSLSNSHNNVASIQKNRGDKSYRIIVALVRGLMNLMQLKKQCVRVSIHS